MKMNEKNEKPSKIIGIQFSILSPEEIRRGSVAEIVTRDTYINNKPVQSSGCKNIEDYIKNKKIYFGELTK